MGTSSSRPPREDHDLRSGTAPNGRPRTGNGDRARGQAARGRRVVGSLRDVPRLADVVAVLDGRYPPEAAAEWDAVGPVTGDPAAEVRTVVLAVDPVESVVEEALELGAQLLVTHHPLFLRGTSTVYGGTAKGRLVQRLVT